MDKDRTENFESPLDEVLRDFPQENPPTDLQQRCLGALDEIDAAQSRLAAPRWYAPLRNVVATAAVLVLAVGLFTLLPFFMSAKQAPQPGQPVPKVATGPGMAPGMPGPAPAPPAEAVDELRPETALPDDVGYLQDDVWDLGDRVTALEEAKGPEVTGMTESPTGWVDYMPGLEPTELPEKEQSEAGEERASAGTMFYRVGGALASKPPQPVTLGHPASRSGQPPQAPEVEEPWRDLSGGRQVVVDKELELEVKDVEKSYDEARSIVEKHGGFVASDEISIDAHALDTAVLTIRLPKDGFEAAITELRELGTVLKLVGESQDVTQEYFGRGAEIRSRADREQMLVEKYEKETNLRKKRQLKDEIEQLRREMRREKEILTKLAEETHWPTLQLTLKERGGPAGFLSEMLERSGHALAWVGATAIIWVPLVVLLTLFRGRLRRTN